MPVTQTLWLPSLGSDASGHDTPVDDRGPKLILARTRMLGDRALFGHIADPDLTASEDICKYVILWWVQQDSNLRPAD